jgi:hypothetical protein
LQKEFIGLHTHQEVIVEKEEAWLGGTEGKGGGYSERRKTKNIFKKVVISRGRFFNKRGVPGSKNKEKVMKQKIRDTIKNKVLIAMDQKSVRWCNQYRLVFELNRGYMLVVDMREVNYQ